MFRQHVLKDLSAYCQDELSTENVQRIAAHLLVCKRCRHEYEEIKLGVRLAQQLSNATAPDSLWQNIEAALNGQSRAAGGGASSSHRFNFFNSWHRFAAVCASLLSIIALSLIWTSMRTSGGVSWEVARLAGAPQIGGERISDTGRLAIGEWLQTDERSSAQIHVAQIGQVEIEPNTRVRLVATNLTEHRLELARGTLHAQIWAPPRLFFVDTPSAVAADLGCAYTLETDDAGRSLLHVTSGWVALERKDRESIVPAGAACATQPNIGPGTPYFEDASRDFLDALNKFDFAQGGREALNVVLSESRLRDTLTLWHLLARVNDEDRLLVYQRLALLAPPPAGATREGVMRLDSKMLDLWKDDLESKWLQGSPPGGKTWGQLWQDVSPVPRARRIWRKLSR